MAITWYCVVFHDPKGMILGVWSNSCKELILREIFNGQGDSGSGIYIYCNVKRCYPVTQPKPAVEGKQRREEKEKTCRHLQIEVNTFYLSSYYKNH